MRRLQPLQLLALTLLAAASGAPAQDLAPTPPPSAANCAALTSGTYRLVSPIAGRTQAEQTDTLAIDAVALTVQRASGAFETWAPAGPCAFTADGGRTEAVVAPGGLFTLRWSPDGGASYRWGVAFPEQKVRLRRLAGAWNFIGLRRNAADTGFTAITAKATLDDAGSVSQLVRCQNDATWNVTGTDCAPVTAGVPRLVVRRGVPGAALVDAASGASLGQAYVYRKRGAPPVMVWASADGGVQFAAPRAPLALPLVGDVTTTWNHYVSAASTSAQPIRGNAGTSTIVSVDAASDSFVRIQKSEGQANDHLETILGNTPDTGYRHRPQQVSQLPDGTPLNVNPWVSLSQPALGFSPFFLPNSRLFALSLVQP